MSKLALQQMGDSVNKLLPKDWGFVILVFPFIGNEQHQSNYISNAKREDIVKYLRESADRLEKKQDFETPDNNMY